MGTGPKAIETVYKGYRFRSRLEARWAVFFDALGIGWDHEKEGYDLDGVWYLPDFWLPKQQTWFEVKSGQPTTDEIEKAKRLARASGYRVLIGLQIPSEWYEDMPAGPDKERVIQTQLGYSPCLWAVNPREPDFVWDGDHMWTQCPTCECFDCTLWGNSEDMYCGHSRNRQCWYVSELKVAYDKARQARFEHGEHGA